MSPSGWFHSLFLCVLPHNNTTFTTSLLPNQSIADGAPQRDNGFMQASTEPGLGVTPKYDVLGKPVFVVE